MASPPLIDIDDIDTAGDLAAVEFCAVITGYLFIQDTLLNDLDGLQKLTELGSHLRIQNNSSLTQVDGLENLASVGGWLEIDSNDVLADLDGLTSIEAVGTHLNHLVGGCP